MIYCQQYLMSQGLAVTWDNPDVHLELGGVPVNLHDLKPNTTYDVFARIWNNSLDAVVVNMPVEFSFLSFGIGTSEDPHRYHGRRRRRERRGGLSGHRACAMDDAADDLATFSSWSSSPGRTTPIRSTMSVSTIPT